MVSRLRYQVLLLLLSKSLTFIVKTLLVAQHWHMYMLINTNHCDSVIFCSI